MPNAKWSVAKAVMWTALVLLMGTGSYIQAQGKVCAHPEHPCGDFEDNELSFKITKKFNFDRQRDKSAPFYAIILKSAELCHIPAEDRLKAQALFPKNKVFVHQYMCQDFHDNVTYTNINPKFGFLAVYAGDTPAEARKMLTQVKSAGQFPSANIRRMQVVQVYQLE